MVRVVLARRRQSLEIAADVDDAACELVGCAPSERWEARFANLVAAATTTVK